ncbi:DUF1918 domain-containing protein [Streptomyces sp. NPDC048566]|uniref:DUF1918 domain-containing protein n=1 Tax=Streptomyces sp. NPDC048566 TaxID=3365569 RepID=UPI00371E3F09
MHAHAGDVMRFTSRKAGQPEHRATVVDVLGADGEPPYRLRYDDGHESEIFPGPGCVIEERGDQAADQAHARRTER